MAVVVKADVIQGARSSRALRKGREDTRIFTVEGVVGDGFARISNAMDAPGVPKEGNPHPEDDTIIVKDIDGYGVSTDIIFLAIKYASPDSFAPTADQVIITVSTSLTTTETNLDVDGNVLQTQYTYPVDYKETPSLAGETFAHGAMVTRLIPTTVKTFTKLQDFDPSVLSSEYAGRINSLAFEGGVPGSWMCTNISGNTQDGGKTWTNSYSFEFRYDGWNQDIVFISKDLGEPPVFATLTELALGVTNWQIYPAKNFDDLSLT